MGPPDGYAVRDGTPLFPGARSVGDGRQHDTVVDGLAVPRHRRDGHRPAEAQGRGRRPGLPRGRAARPWVVVGGQSFGGRVASLAAAEPGAPYAALVLFSYPLHPPGSPEKTEARIAHWPPIRCPVLLLSGRSRPVRPDRAAAGGGPDAAAAGRARDLPAARARAQAGARRRARSGRRVPRRRTLRQDLRHAPCPDRCVAPRILCAPGGRRPTSPGRPGPVAAGVPSPRPPSPAATLRPDRADVRCAHRIVPVGRSHIASPVRPPKRGPRRPPRDDPGPRASGSAVVRRQGPTRPGSVHERRRPQSSPAATTRAEHVVRRVRQVPDHAVELAGLGRASTSATQRQADPGQPGEGRRGQDDARSTAGSAAGGASRTGGSPARREDGLVELRDALRRPRSWRYYGEAGGKDERRRKTAARAGPPIERSQRDRLRGHLAARQPRRLRRRRGRLRDEGRRDARRFTSPAAVAWNGPTGPTRGQAKVYIDGKDVKTVDLYRAHVRRRARRSSRPAGSPPASTRSRSSSSAPRATDGRDRRVRRHR